MLDSETGDREQKSTEDQKRFTVTVKHKPVTSSSAGWTKIKHKSPLYNSPFDSDFIILGTEVDKKKDFRYTVTQHIELIGRDEDEVVTWLENHESIDSTSIYSRRNT